MASVNAIRLKRSNVSGFIPASNQLIDGELFLNTADRLVFMKDNSGNVTCVGKTLDSLDPNKIYIPLSSFGSAPNYGTKGTMLVANGTGALVPLPPGINGQALVARSTATLGIAWENVTASTAPVISTVLPSTSASGGTITITGTNFGASRIHTPNSYVSVRLSGETTLQAVAGYTSWSDTQIVCSLPSIANGSYYVNVHVSDNVSSHVNSNDVLITVSSVSTSPTITSVAPTSGAIGSSVTITGTNFGASQGTNNVYFNGTTAGTATSWSATSIVINVPTGATTGNVSVSIGGVSSNGVTYTVTTSASPTITSLNPTSGAIGASVTITGTNFGASQGSSNVYFNGTLVTSYTSWTATSIVCAVPSGTTTGNVIVIVGGVSSNSVTFTISAGSTPVISSVAPTTVNGGGTVTITGTGFGTTQYSVMFKNSGSIVVYPATVSSWSATSIVCTVPSGVSGSATVFVRMGEFAYTDSNEAAITVNASVSPAITSLNPSAGYVGTTSVTITGTNFGASQGSSTVTFNSTAATITSWSATSIVCTVPTGATTGNVVVTVSGNASNGSAFTILVPTPYISGLSTNIGDVGSQVIITGSGFGATQGTSTVKFGTIAATCSSWAAGSITCTVPSGTVTDPNYVYITVTVGTQTSSGAIFTVNTDRPIISELSPSSGSSGTAVTINGVHFGSTQGTGYIMLGSALINGTYITSWADTSIHITIPSYVDASGNIVVYASNGKVSPGVWFSWS